MKTLTLLVVAYMLVLCACSSLRVQVSVLNPEVVREMATKDRLDRAMPYIMAETDTSISQFFADRAKIHAELYRKLRMAYADEAKQLPAGSKARQRLEFVGPALEMPESEKADYRYWEMRFASATKTLQTDWPLYQNTTDSAERLRLRSELIAALDERQAVRTAVDRAAINDFGEKKKADLLSEVPPELQARLKPTIQDIQRTGQEQVAQQATQLFNSGDIQNSPYAFYVAKADDDKWGSHFDHTVGRGTFGNTDIAIKALAPGNYTIKGVSFNPADVAAVASKVTSQTVLLAAQVAGVPVKVSGTPAQGAAGGALAQSSQGLNELLGENERVDQRLVGQRDALRHIAAAIVNERNTVLKGTTEQRKASLEAIKAVYESHAAQLRVSDAK